jgi:hypothetical protein
MSLSSVTSVSSLACLASGIVLAAAMAPQPAFAIAPPDARAVCRAAGGIVLSKSENAVACNKGGVGRYNVIIANPVDNCTFVATLGLPGDNPPLAGEIGVAQGATDNRVRVFTRDSAGVLIDRAFHLVVAC